MSISKTGCHRPFKSSFTARTRFSASGPTWSGTSCCSNVSPPRLQTNDRTDPRQASDPWPLCSPWTRTLNASRLLQAEERVASSFLHSGGTETFFFSHSRTVCCHLSSAASLLLLLVLSLSPPQSVCCGSPPPSLSFSCCWPCCGSLNLTPRSFLSPRPSWVSHGPLGPPVWASSSEPTQTPRV